MIMKVVLFDKEGGPGRQIELTKEELLNYYSKPFSVTYSPIAWILGWKIDLLCIDFKSQKRHMGVYLAADPLTGLPTKSYFFHGPGDMIAHNSDNSDLDLDFCMDLIWFIQDCFDVITENRSCSLSIWDSYQRIRGHYYSWYGRKLTEGLTVSLPRHLPKCLESNKTS